MSAADRFRQKAAVLEQCVQDTPPAKQQEEGYEQQPNLPVNTLATEKCPHCAIFLAHRSLLFLSSLFYPLQV